MFTRLLVCLYISIVMISCQTIQNERKRPISNYKPKTREYFIAAEPVIWDYAPSGKNLIHQKMGLGEWGKKTKYHKVRYIEYTDSSFKTPKPQEEYLGILGPIIRAAVGDTIKVHFKNRGKRSYSIHPHGVFYTKENEGANYSGNKTLGGSVPPEGTYTYTWEVNERAGPGPQDGSSVVWMYHSHVDSVRDIYEGLLGPMIVTAAEFATDDARPKDVDREFVNLFMVNNESPDDEEIEGDLMHSINGYIFGNLPGLVMNKNERIRWYLIGMGTEVDLHTAHWHGETVLHQGRRKDVVELLPASLTYADMIASNPGKWLYHCHVTDHITAGMIATYRIR